MGNGHKIFTRYFSSTPLPTNLFILSFVSESCFSRTTCIHISRQLMSSAEEGLVFPGVKDCSCGFVILDNSTHCIMRRAVFGLLPSMYVLSPCMKPCKECTRVEKGRCGLICYLGLFTSIRCAVCTMR